MARGRESIAADISDPVLRTADTLNAVDD